jgi:hypothetical protein
MKAIVHTKFGPPDVLQLRGGPPYVRVQIVNWRERLVYANINHNKEIQNESDCI